MSHRRGVWVLIGLATVIISVMIAVLWGGSQASAGDSSPMRQVAVSSVSGEQETQPALAAHLPAAELLSSQTAQETVEPMPPATPYPPSDNCVNCHTDKAKLQKLAEKPKEAKSELTSGEG